VVNLNIDFNIVKQKKACRETSLLYIIKYYSSVTSRRVDVNYSTTKYVLFDFSFCQIYSGNLN